MYMQRQGGVGMAGSGAMRYRGVVERERIALQSGAMGWTERSVLQSGAMGWAERSVLQSGAMGWGWHGDHVLRCAFHDRGD